VSEQTEAEKLRAEDTVVLTIRVACVPDELVNAGSVVRDCTRCAERVWVSPLTQQALASGKVVDNLVCCDCMDLHGPGGVDRLLANSHSHSWEGPELVCVCGATFAQFRQEVGDL